MKKKKKLTKAQELKRTVRSIKKTRVVFARVREDTYKWLAGYTESTGIPMGYLVDQLIQKFASENVSTKTSIITDTIEF